jgi:hypothetical protein
VGVPFFMPKSLFTEFIDRPQAYLLNGSFSALQTTRQRLQEMLENGSGLVHQKVRAPDGTWKEMLLADIVAEETCANILVNLFNDDNIRVLGEETLWKFKGLDLTKERLEGYGSKAKRVPIPETRLTAIIDMVDGSDLAERGLGNWCSALIVFRPEPYPRILFSMVQNSDGKIYGADEHGTFGIFPLAPRLTGEKQYGFKATLDGPEPRRLIRSVVDRDLPEETDQLTICFYGQKFGHFTTIPSRLCAWIKSHPARERFRIYNLAGNPMMVRLANGERIHAVFEHIGQYPHDAAPGAYIGMRSGGSLVDFAGHDISEETLASRLLQPSGAQFKYVLASSRELAKELTKVLRDEARNFYVCANGDCKAEFVLEGGAELVCQGCGHTLVVHDRRGKAATA